MGDIVPVKTALLSVYHKDGIVEMARILSEAGVTIFASKGTTKALAEAGIKATDIAERTGVPPLFGHRLVTLHPVVHGGISYRRGNEADEKDKHEYNNANKHGIEPIDLVVVNVYPAQDAIAKGEKVEKLIEVVDIGGPTMIRNAAKNYLYTSVVVNPHDYLWVAQDIAKHGGLTLRKRKGLAAKAFGFTAKYDTEISAHWQAELDHERH